MNKIDKIKTGYKETKVGMIPEDWTVDNLGECSIDEPKYGINASSVEYNPQLPLYLRITDIDDNGRFSKGKMRSVDHVDSKNFYLKKGDIVFVRTGSTTGKAYLYDELDGALVYAGFLIKFSINKDKLLSNFLKHYCETQKYNNWVSVMSGRSGQPGINGQEYSELPIPLPPLPEQKKIAEILSTWDRAIEKTEKLIDAKTKLKKGLMLKLLTGQKRLKEFKNSKRINVKLGDIFEERNEFKYHDLELLSITSTKGVVKRDSINKADTSNDDKSKYRRICPGDIGYNTMRMWQGVSGVSNFEGIVSPAYTVVIPNENIDSQFMGYLFKLPDVIHLFHRHSQGLVDDTLNLKYHHFSQIHVTIPEDKKEQQRIASVLSTIDKEISVLNKKLKALKQQKKGLMQKLLTGEVRVKV